jgi:hypothetical protein
MLKANIAQVNIGPIIIEGLMDEDGDYYVAIPQIAELFSILIKNASRDLKALLGKTFSVLKFKTPLHSGEVNVVPLKGFEKILFELTLKGNPKAIEMSRALIGMSLYQLFCDSFGVKFESEDRQRWLETRFKTKHDFRPLTDQLQKYGFERPQEYARYISMMQEKIGVENGTRDFLEFKVLNRLERTQDRLTVYMECGFTPYEALDKLKIETL